MISRIRGCDIDVCVKGYSWRLRRYVGIDTSICEEKSSRVEISFFGAIGFEMTPTREVDSHLGFFDFWTIVERGMIVDLVFWVFGLYGEDV